MYITKSQNKQICLHAREAEKREGETKVGREGQREEKAGRGKGKGEGYDK